MSEYKLSKTIDVSVDVAKELIDKFFTQVPQVKNYLNNLGRFAIAHNFAVTPPPFKRRRYFEDPGSDFSKIGNIERAGKNHPIQGGNADLTKASLVLIRNYIIEHNIDVKIVNVIHDEIITECKNELAEEWKPIMESLMIQAAQIVIKNVPVKVDCKITEYWKK